MNNRIHTLPKDIAEKIASGEVIERPLSVVKELVENAVDAGAKSLSVVILDAGRTLIQVIDDGCGMTADEALLCFERHATSKISEAEDLERISTFGFRGEALASIAAVAEVTLKTRREAESLSQVIEYMDSRTGEKKCMIMRDLVFINYRTGEPNKNSSYDTHLYKLCDEAGIPRFCMHALRHTYATRAIERGVQPKVLQQLLGHASIKTTMDRYVHVTDDSMLKAVRQFESACT